MTIEKKKRIPKPKLGIITDFVLNYCLPFLNLREDHFSLPGDDDSDLLRAAVREILNPFQFQSGRVEPLPVAIRWNSSLENEFFRLPETRNKLKEIQGILRNMINLAVNDIKYTSGKDVLEAMSAYKFDKALYPIRIFQLNKFIPIRKLGVRDSQNIKDQEQFNSVWTTGLPAIISEIVTSALSEGLYKEIEPVPEGSIDAGRETFLTPISCYLGYCPKCGLIFQKDQMNQDFCSYQCGSIYRVNRIRQKKKKPQ